MTARTEPRRVHDACDADRHNRSACPNGSRSNIRFFSREATNLQRSLDLALPIAGSEWNLGGAALYERIGEDWAITNSGVEHRKLGLVLPRKDFPELEYPFQLPGAKPKKPWNPIAPDGVDASEWSLVVERASRYLRFPR